MAGDEDGPKSTWLWWLAPGDTRHTKDKAQHVVQTEHAKRTTGLSNESEPVTSRTVSTGLDSPEMNPFIVFKHFIDDKFAALADFSSNLTELRKRTQQPENAIYDTCTRDQYKRWTGIYGLPPDCQWREPSPFLEEAKAAASMLMEESRQRNCYIPTRKILKLYQEDGDFDHHRYDRMTALYGERHVPIFHYARLGRIYQALPSASQLLSPDWRDLNDRIARTRWLSIQWFIQSPYSPVNLEADSDLSKYDTKWRNAFEDLLEASLDKPMTSRERFGKRVDGGPVVSTWRGPGLDWMLSLVCRGILPPQLTGLYRHLVSEESHHPEYLSAVDLKSVETVPVLEPSLAAFQAPRQPRLSELAHYEYMQMVIEIATTIPKDATPADSRLLVSQEQEVSPGPRHDPMLNDYQLQKMQGEHAYQSADSQVDSTESRCPDELGRAVGDVARPSNSELHDLSHAHMQRKLEARNQETAELMHERGASITDWDWEGITPEERQQWREGRTSSERRNTSGGPITELDVYEYMDRHGDSGFQQDSAKPICGVQRNSPSVGKCPDELGRAVGEAARQQAARAFADEENALGNEDEDVLDVFEIERLLYTHKEDFVGVSLVADHFKALQSLMERLKDVGEAPTVAEFQRLRGVLSERIDSLLDRQEDLRKDNHKLVTILQNLLQDRAGDEQQSGSDVSHFTAREVVMERSGFEARLNDETYLSTLLALDHLVQQIWDLKDESSAEFDQLVHTLSAGLKLLMREHWLMLEDHSKILTELKAVKEEREEGKAAKIQGSKELSDRPFGGSLGAQANADKPGVLSTLTTTQTTRLPDGSLKTSVVLKRRFADGREETQESTQTSFDDNAAASGPVGHQEAQKEKKKGWFWN